MKKICTTCEREKSSKEFGVRAASRDGLTAACRECLKKRDAARYPKEREYRLAQHKLYMQGDAGRAAHAAAAKRWREANAIKRAAHVILNNAIRAGAVTKEKECSSCGKRKQIHAHHDDYSKPLEVRWLCVTCHVAWHKQNEPIGF